MRPCVAYDKSGSVEGVGLWGVGDRGHLFCLFFFFKKSFSSLEIALQENKK